MARDNLPKKVVNSAALEAYSLKKSSRQVLEKSDRLRAYMQLGGKQLPNHIRLYPQDWLDIDRIVRDQSEGKRTARDVTWGGVPLARSDEPEEAFALKAEAA